MLRVGAEYDNMSLYYNNMTRYITAPHVNIKRLGGGGAWGPEPGGPCGAPELSNTQCC